jgi:hypothetical protein
MNLHLVEISANVAPGAHAVLTIDGAGWHQTGDRPSPEASHVIPSALRPSRTDRRRATPSAGDETSRCLDKVRLCILESSTTLGKPVARVEAAGRIAFRVGNVVNTLEKALSWLDSQPHDPCRRFTLPLAEQSNGTSSASPKNSKINPNANLC